VGYPEVLAEPGSKVLMLGNVAVARACLEYGVGLASGYPGTPSSEVVEALAYAASKLGYPYVEWSVNEKVAFEVAYGAAISGVPSVVSMKHVGLNVAADPFFSSAYTGVEASLLVISADDPGMWSSQNEQDNRWYGVHAYIPVVEPAGAQEAREAALEALRLSGEVRHPVLLRLVTRVSHTRAPVTVGALGRPRLRGVFKSIPSRWNLIPAHARRLREELLERWRRIEDLVSRSELNVAEGPRDSQVVVIGVGVGYRYAREALRRLKAQVRLVKVTTPVPLPSKFVLGEVEGRDSVLVVEEGDPVFETMIKTLLQEVGLNTRVYGKRSGHLRATGELRLEDVEGAIAQVLGLGYRRPELLEATVKPPPRPPVLCPGCPYRSVFYAVRRAVKRLGLDVVYSGDIGCYSLAVNKPFNAQDTLIEMGGSVGLANGMSHVLGGRVVIATIGDSTFYHAGIPGLINAVYNKAPMMVLVLDNGVTAMTGHQPHPGSGFNAMGGEARRIPVEDVARGVGVDSVYVAEAFNPRDVEAKALSALRDVGEGKISVVIARGPCILMAMSRARAESIPRPSYVVDSSRCRGCMVCYKAFNCPAITPSGDGKITINKTLCTGCGVCERICPFNAIKPASYIDERWWNLLGLTTSSVGGG